jgi:hypothetical protein
VVMVILTTGKTFPLFTWNHFWALGTLEFGLSVRPPPVKWSDCRKFEKQWFREAVNKVL